MWRSIMLRCLSLRVLWCSSYRIYAGGLYDFFMENTPSKRMFKRGGEALFPFR